MSVKRFILFAIPLAILVVVGFLVQLGSAPLQVSEEATADIPQWELPNSLREASGLAMLNETQVLIHNDEKGFVYLVTLPEQRIDRLAVLGEKRIKDDYEGIAIQDDRVYLVTSLGMLYKASGLNAATLDQTLVPEIIDTRFGEVCEIEGLAIEGDRLLMPCKTPLTDEFTDQLVVFYYSIDDGATGVHLAISEDQTGLKNPQPTAIEVTDSHYYVISGNRLLTIDKTTSTVSRYKLPRKRHPQPEGIALMPDGSIIIVDDMRRGIGRLTRYSGLDQLELKE